MKLYRQDEVPEDEQGLLCRQSRLAGVVRMIVWRGILAVPPYFGWRLGEPWLMWIGIGLAAIVIPVGMADLGLLFRPTNWLLRIGTDGVWINLRSYRDQNVIPDAFSVVHLGYEEIASVRRHTEKYATPTEKAGGPGSHGAVGGSTEWRDTFLEIELNHDQTQELKTALNDLRFPPAPTETASGPVLVRGRISPVWFVNPSRLRIGWVSGHGAAVMPHVLKALSLLDGSVRVAEPTRRVRPNWRKLKAAEATDLARELVHVHGDTSEAMALLVRAAGIPYAEAIAQVEQFEREEIGSVEQHSP